MSFFIVVSLVLCLGDSIIGNEQKYDISLRHPYNSFLMKENHLISTDNDSLNVRLIGQYPSGSSSSVEVDEDRRLVFIGTTDRIIILDISDPADPVYISDLETSGNHYIEDLDYSDNYLYVVDYGGSPSFKVVSVADPGSPEIVGGFYVGGSAQSVAVKDTIAYVGSDYTGGVGGLEILSVANPSDVQSISNLAGLGTAWQVLIDDTLAYIAAESFGLQIVSISNPLNPYVLGQHQTIGVAVGVAVVDTISYLATFGSIRIINVSDPSNPTEVDSFMTVDTTWGIAIDDSIAYLASSGGGIRVLSISDPSNLYEMGFYQTSGRAEAVIYSEPYAYVATEAGLMIFEYYDPTSIGNGSDVGVSTPRTFSLSQNYPNPFNPSTTINYTLPIGEMEKVRLCVYDLRGRKVKTLVDEAKKGGSYSIHWDGKDDIGMVVGSGIYLYRLTTCSTSLTKKMLILQ